MRDKAVKQQLLTPSEEKALARYLLRMACTSYPLPAKLLCSLAAVILRRRAAFSNGPKPCQAVRCPGRNWALAFLRRYPEVKARRIKAVDWKRYDHNIYDKTKEWFDIIGGELHAPTILQENVYNMDETGTLLSALKSLRVLVGRDDLRNYRGAVVQRTLVTAIECISADGRSLNPLIIWPAVTHRSTWTTHSTPGWHFACTENGILRTQVTCSGVDNKSSFLLYHG